MTVERKREIQILLSGGGDDIYKVLEKVIEKESCVFKDKTISYVAIAAEKNRELFSLIKNGWSELHSFFLKKGGKSANLVSKVNISELYSDQVVILSGGDTETLIKSLIEDKFKHNLFESKIDTIIGISAGAIALSKQGLGTLNGSQFLYSKCLEILPSFIVPHSDSEKEKIYPKATHLKDYEVKSYFIKIKDQDIDSKSKSDK